ncbi:hypothetical protein CSUI_006902 [Cystoisospora suis]|uniref:Uncharacterized protein n=1 Tax=Cystoisospora suis TaxID=483139 RepID=A0A2C6KQ67_9APIC|nr:hypothetical protein CSUI_006902 [Cystoisospora suis]
MEGKCSSPALSRAVFWTLVAACLLVHTFALSVLCLVPSPQQSLSGEDSFPDASLQISEDDTEASDLPSEYAFAEGGQSGTSPTDEEVRGWLQKRPGWLAVAPRGFSDTYATLSVSYHQKPPQERVDAPEIEALRFLFYAYVRYTDAQASYGQPLRGSLKSSRRTVGNCHVSDDTSYESCSGAFHSSIDPSVESTNPCSTLSTREI